MQFTSLHFALFFVVVLLGLLLLRRQDHKICWLLAAGVFFYGYWNWHFLALIGFTSVFDFFMGLWIAEAQGAKRRRLLVLDIFVNLGILCIFKYCNFFIESANVALSPLGFHLPTLAIILPIGISFFVFETMSYCIDVYRGTLKPYTDWKNFALFVFFFPRMVAGPIIRPADFLPQLQRPILLRMPNVVVGGQMFLLGLTKKLVIADRLAPFVDLMFASPGNYSGWTLWQGIIAYSIQIFCDFSGYSDMALGLAKIMGFDLPVNFRMPYLANNITDFWRRWHLSLSSWLRDYLYIPLGGNRKGVSRTYINLFITMVLGGLWHGPSWNFVVWGALHGVGLAIHKGWTTLVGGKVPDSPAVRVVSWATTYLFVCLGWIFFRTPSFETALTYLTRMTGLATSGVSWWSAPLAIIAPGVVIAHVCGLLLQRRKHPFVLALDRIPHLTLLFIWMLGIYFLAATDVQPFIYFQF